MLVHQLDQFDQLMGGGFAAGFFFYGSQDLQIKAMGERVEELVEKNFDIGESKND